MADVQVNWFEIPVRDVAAAARFYGAVFQQELLTMEGPDGPVHAFTHGDRPVGAVMRQGEPGNRGIDLYLDAQGDLDAMLERVTAAGGTIVMPRTAIGPYGHIAQFTDPDGNRIGLHTM